MERAFKSAGYLLRIQIDYKDFYYDGTLNNLSAFILVIKRAKDSATSFVTLEEQGVQIR